MAAAKMEQVDPIKNLTSILDLFQGKNESVTTSGSTTTTKVDFSEAQVADQIRSILGSTQGLASIASGEKMSGMYNTTSKQQAMNDLLAKITSEVTAKKVGTTVTKTPEVKRTETPGALGEGKGLQALLGLAGSSVLAPSLKRAKGKLGIPDLGESLADMLFGAGAAETTGGSIMGSVGGAAEAFSAAYPAAPAALGGELGSGLFGMTELEGLLGGSSVAGLGSQVAAGGTAVGSGLLPAIPGVGWALAGAIGLDQMTKTSKLEDVGQNIINDPLKALGDTLGGFVGNFGGLFK